MNVNMNCVASELAEDSHVTYFFHIKKKKSWNVVSQTEL